MKQVTRLKEILSPAPGASISARMAGRFGHQMVGDTTAFAHNLPHRLLLWDCLDRLPEILDKLLDNSGLRELIRDSALRAANVDEIADSNHRTQLEATIRDDLKRIWALSSAHRRTLVEHSADLLCAIAAEAWRATDTDQVSDVEKKLSSRYVDSAFPARWFFVLQEALPHLEREIWLTETSAPLPAHALMRMHDNWALFVLLWCYVSRKSLRGAKTSEEGEAEFSNAFFTTVLKVAVIGEWAAVAQKPDSTLAEHQVKLVVGPVFVLNDTGAQTPDQVKPHLRCARQFLTYMRISADVIPEWSSWGAVSSLEELMDAYDSRFPVASYTDLNVRCNGVRQAWLRVHEVQLAWPNHDLTRDDWEFCAAICAWTERWEEVLTPVLQRSGPQLVGLPRWERNAIRIAANPGKPIEVSLVNTAVEPAIGWLNRIKETEPDFDLPLVLWNRLRERQTAAWSAAIGAMSNLMQRRSTRPGRFRKAGRGPFEASHLLHGFGDRLCRYIVNIGQSDQASVYWLDYEENPPRLKLVASYSRAIRARSQRLKVHKEFDGLAYKSDDPTASCNARRSAVSLAYRCAAANGAEVWSDGVTPSDQPGILAAGHSDQQIPRSAMAVPLRANGRVIGVLELAGSTRGQFGKQLRAPLRRVASLVGPVLYQNLLLWQLGRINMWTASLSPYAMEAHHNNRLSELASLLCNVFACPLVHIWLRGPNLRLFELEGSSRAGLFEFRASRRESPFFIVQDIAFETVGPTVPFEVAALALWNVPRPPRGRSGGAPARRTPAWGNLVKAIYNPALKASGGDLESALGEGICLGQDFLAAPEPHSHLRHWIVSKQGLNEMAAFAIVREVTEAGGASANGDSEAIGVVTLHDYGDGRGESIAENDGDPVLKQSTFGVAWLPIVAFMQEHLSNVLPQVRLLNDQVDQVRQILLHEARHEVRTAADHFQRLFVCWRRLKFDPPVRALPTQI